MSFRKYFDEIFYINLKRRSDRYSAMEQLLTRLDLPAERFEAVEFSVDDLMGFPETVPQFLRRSLRNCPEDMVRERLARERGAFGCAASHLGAIKEALARDAQNVLVLEDDLETTLTPDEILLTLSEAFRELAGRHWDILYLGYYPTSPTRPVSRHLEQVRDGYGAHAICYNQSIFHTALDFYEYTDHPHIDVFLSRSVHRAGNSYAICPEILYQRQGDRSDIGTDNRQRGPRTSGTREIKQHL